MDLNYVLIEEPTEREKSPSCASTAESDEERDYHEGLEENTMYYNKLIENGGRPSHPISLGDNGARNSEEYREILSYWKSPSHRYDWMVFMDQCGAWSEFREAQRRMRIDGPLEEGKYYPPGPAKPGRFAGYRRTLRKRLARYGFKQSFQLNVDSDRQDKLTTWMEYLSFKYVPYESRVNVMKSLQQQHDEAWKKLVDSKVLKPSETEESFGYFLILQMLHEINEAENALESATLSVKLLEKQLSKAQSAGLSERSLLQTEQKLSEATSILAVAKKSVEHRRRRDELIRGFMGQTMEYGSAKDDSARRGKLLRWILRQIPLIERELNAAKVTENGSTQQVPLIELELDAAKVTENDSTGGNDRCQPSLKRSRTDESDDEPVSKRQRQDGENPTLPESKALPSTIQEASPGADCPHSDTHVDAPNAEMPSIEAVTV